jgi:two-component system response regulator HupR/HoxA
MQDAFALMEKAIDSDLTVLISGETGTGKELVAKAIHYNGRRKDKPLVVQNCAAIPQNLLESELFGHVKGAFTDAIKDRKGLFESADNGTLFLDEIGDMSQDLQARLLRVLEDGEIKRVGDTHSKRVDVRIISATNRNLWEEVSAGRFREDLYYRLSAFPIVLPPLKERINDIPALAAHFLKECNRTMKKSITGFNSEAMSLLMDYPWPGNVRELENEIKRAATLADDNEIITPSMLSDKIKGVVFALQAGDDKPAPLKAMIEKVERSLILKALNRHNGNVTRTAVEIGISRVALQKKMKKYRLREE